MERNKKRANRLFPGSLIACLALFAEATATVSTFRTTAASTLWLDVSSNVHDVRCHAAQLTGAGIFDGESFLQRGRFDSVATSVQSASLTIVSSSFDCGSERRNRDIVKLVRGAEFPHISYRVHTAEVTAYPDSADRGLRARVAGELAVAGVSRNRESTIEARRVADGSWRLVGRLPLRMTDFGIAPPTALFGLIRVQDRLVVNFDLHVVRRDD